MTSLKRVWCGPDGVPSDRRTRGRIGLVGAICFGLVASTIALGSGTSEASPPASPPNIVVILTDDQPVGMLGTMPFVRDQILPVSTRFQKAITPTPVCCPSRTSLLTGKYANDTGVYGVSPKKFGGYSVFQENGNQDESIAVKLSETGYATGLFGKYLNGYHVTPGDLRPPGWNRWAALVDGAGSNKYTDYVFTADEPGLPLEDAPSSPLRLQTSDGRYSTNHMGEAAADFIDEVPTEQPLFALYTPYGPHAPYTPEPKYAYAGVNPPWGKTPRVEKDVSDKPRWVQKQSKKIKMAGHSPRTVWRKQTAVLRSVDDQVANIVDALKRTGRWENTILVFTSDNGFAFGQNRVTTKNNPYRPSTEVDLVVHSPGQDGPSTNSDLVSANVDVAATILVSAGLANSTSGLPLGRASERLGIPVMASWTKVRGRKRPPYCGWRTATELFVRYGSKEEEYYNYSKDPGGHENLVAIRPPVTGNQLPTIMKKPTRKQRRNAARAAELRTLAGAACTNPSPDFGPSFYLPTWRYRY